MNETTKVIPQEYAEMVANSLKQKYNFCFNNGCEIGNLICKVTCKVDETDTVISEIEKACNPMYIAS